MGILFICFREETTSTMKSAILVCLAALAAAEPEADAFYGSYGYNNLGLGYSNLGYGYNNIGLSTYSRPVVSSYSRPIVSSYARPIVSRPIVSSYSRPIVSSYSRPIVSGYSSINRIGGLW